MKSSQHSFDRVPAAMALAVTFVLAAVTLGDAADNCRVKIVPRTGEIQVSASNVSANPRWGTALGTTTATFFNQATCFNAGSQSLSRCTLGNPTLLAGMTPPANCKVCVGDDGPTDCCAFPKGCIPGIRLRDASFDASDPRFESLEAVAAPSKTLRFAGVNVQVVDGSGDTGGPTNGLGNLIVGYNESGHGFPRTGSHNIVVGQDHGYTSYGGLVAGKANKVSGPFASVNGGYENTAAGDQSSVNGGSQNTAAGDQSSVSGGYQNTAAGDQSSVSGGGANTASGIWSSVSGGSNNTAAGDQSSVSGGAANVASGAASSVSGGALNMATGTESSVSAGRQNTAAASYSSVSGGEVNVANNGSASISGGHNNTATGWYTSVSGGAGNEARGQSASVSGGTGSIASGDTASVSGGSSNVAAALSSSVSGGTAVILGAGGVNEWHAGRTSGYPVASYY